MLHILLLILKIIGITVVVLLGLVMLVLCILLFAPIRYQVKAETSDGMKNLKVVAKASWILYLATAKYIYNKGKSDWQVRIAWKKLNETTKKKVEAVIETAVDEVEEPVHEMDEEAQENDNSKNAQETVPKQSETKQSRQSDDKKKTSWFDKLKCTIKNICDKIKALWETKEKIADFLMKESHIKTFQILKDEFVTLARRIRPRKIQGQIRFGLDDPYRTGQVLAVLSVLYPFYGEHVQIYPEFEREILEGDLYMKGYIRLIYLVIPVCKLYFDEHVRETYKDYKRLNNDLRRL